MLHDEGADHILRRTFPIGGDFTAVREWLLAVGGLNQMWINQTPNGFPGPGGPPIEYRRETTFTEITGPYANEGGAEGGNGSVHAAILGYTRKPISLTAANDGRSIRILAPEKAYLNQVGWAPWGSYAPDEFKPPDWSGEQWEPEHEYPWQTPTWKDGRWSDPWDDWFRENPHRAGSFTIGMAFILSTATPGMLLCSSIACGAFSIKPGATLYTRCTARLTPPGLPADEFVVTTAFLAHLAGRLNGTASAATNYRMILAANPPGSLSHASTWAEVQPFTAGANPTYVDSPVTSWAKGAPYQTVGTCAGFENTDPAESWETANWTCLVADVNAAPMLCAAEPLIPPRTLGPGDRLLFPSGVTFGLLTGS